MVKDYNIQPKLERTEEEDEEIKEQAVEMMETLQGHL
jgi:hypothetical protein